MDAGPRDDFWQELDKLSVVDVHKRLGSGEWGGRFDALAREWLAHRAAREASASNAATLAEARAANASAEEANSIARAASVSAKRSADAARTSNMIATASAAAAAAAILVSIIGLVHH